MSGTLPRRCNVAIAGFGGIGREIARLLSQRRGRYAERYGCDVRLTGIRRSRTALIDREGLAADRVEASQPVATSGDDFLTAAAADVLVEATPSDMRTGGAGLGYMRAALRQGRHVVAVSKGALVHDGIALRALAARHGVEVKVSAAAGAALPAFDLLHHSVAGCEVSRVEGILNATSNHLLTTMTERRLSLADALAEAQAAGLAEADPSLDIEGWDTASKLVILANFALGAALTIDEVAVSGIAHVGLDDVEAWARAGASPRLVGTLAREGNAIRAEVALRTFPPSDPFAMVRGETKAVKIITDAMGEIFASGCGREPRATAAAALKDVEQILRIGYRLPGDPRGAKT